MTVQNAIFMSAEEYASLPDTDLTELVRGRVIYLTKPKMKHGRIAMRIGSAIAAFVKEHKLGEVYAAETGFIAGRDPDSVRAPDVAFVRAEVVATHNEDEWLPHAPDLAVEVVSPSDRPTEVEDKVAMWLAAGGRAAWVIDPARRIAIIHHPDAAPQIVLENQDLRDDLVLHGFSMPLKAAFDAGQG